MIAYFGSIVVMTLLVIGLQMLVSTSGVDAGTRFGDLLVVTFIVSIVAFVRWRIRILSQALKKGYFEGRTKGMTEAQVKVYQAAPKFVDQYQTPLAFVLMALVVLMCVIMLPISAPIFLFMAIRGYRQWSLLRQETEQKSQHGDLNLRAESGQPSESVDSVQ